ncbi:RBBP9/YdeN family alpha/beta hydrolase [Demequina globuliformis]|uniref:RBBP9/YdeN family alpha/beta hydrolase n=1 Tax=Demequina globuliformis TaxID=676202 RepID=UPI000780ED9F|nr:alpha/beta hydrolase [Demequina globuliformis]
MTGPDTMSDAVLSVPLVVVPGWGGSGPLHWQTLWQGAHPRATRFEPASVDDPDPHDWLEALGRAVDAQEEPPLIVAHSLGTLTTATWMNDHPGQARGALLVAPPDVSREGAPAAVRQFSGLTARALAQPARVVASTNDPYGSVEFAGAFAQRLGAPLTTVGEAGHINADSGLGRWAYGLRLLDDLACAAGAR